MLSKYGTECHHCLWMSMNANWNQKSMNLSMYATLSRHIENSIQGQKTEEFIPELGEGLVIETGGGVCSGKLPIDSPADFYIAGSFDHLAKLKDGTHAVIDDKTSSARPENLLAEKQSETYASQVNAYAYALEKPGTQRWIDKVYESKNHVNSRRMVPKIARKKICVSRLGLNNFTVDSLAHTTNGAFNFTTNRVWAEVGKDYDSLFGLCQKIADISVNSAPPESSQDCNFCKDFSVHKKWRNM